MKLTMRATAGAVASLYFAVNPACAAPKQPALSWAVDVGVDCDEYQTKDEQKQARNYARGAEGFVETLYDQTTVSGAVSVVRRMRDAHGVLACERQDRSDNSAWVTSGGVGALIVGGTKAAATTTTAWTAVALTPVIYEDLTAQRARSRVHATAYGAFEKVLQRHKRIADARAAVEFALSDDSLLSKMDCEKIVRENVGLIQPVKIDFVKKRLLDELDGIRSRCVNFNRSIDGAVALRDEMSDDDAVMVALKDDARNVYRLVLSSDYDLHASPSEAMGVILSSPFSAISSAIRGGQVAESYRGRDIVEKMRSTQHELAVVSYSSPIPLEPDVTISAAALDALETLDRDKAAAIKASAKQLRSNLERVVKDFGDRRVAAVRLNESVVKLQRVAGSETLTFDLASAAKGLVIQPKGTGAGEKTTDVPPADAPPADAPPADAPGPAGAAQSRPAQSPTS